MIWNNEAGGKEEITSVLNIKGALVWKTVTENNLIQYRRPIRDGLEIQVLSSNV